MFSYSDPVAVTPAKRQSYLEFALQVAEAAGQATLPFFRSPLVVQNKLDDGRFDPVTEADHAAERVFRTALRSAYPEHGIFGEEFGHESGNGLTWVIDPIDGTRAFMTGMLHWGLLLALFDGQQPVLGVMHQPYSGETFFGDNESAWHRRGREQRRLETRKGVDLSAGIVATTNPNLFRGPGERAAFDRIESRARLVTYGGDCYLYSLVAMGGIDVATDAGLRPYDIQALIPIVRGAGGCVTTVDGGNASMGGFVVASGSRALHEEVLELIQAAMH
jgi:myo-inositol-1(or 4)-monophosphatase